MGQPTGWNPFEAPLGHMSASHTPSPADFREEMMANNTSRPEMFTPAEQVAPPQPIERPPVQESAPSISKEGTRSAVISPPAESYLPKSIADQLGMDLDQINGPAGAPQIHIFGTPERVNSFVDRLTDHAIAEIARSKPEAETEPGRVNVLVFDNGIVADKETPVPGKQQADMVVEADVMDYVNDLPDPSSRASILSSWEDSTDKLGADVFWREISNRCTVGEEAPDLGTISEAALAVKGLKQFSDAKLPPDLEDRLLGGIKDDETPFPDSLAKHANTSAAVLSNIVANQAITQPTATRPAPGRAATIGVVKINRHPNIDYSTQLQAFNKLASRFTRDSPDVVVIKEGNAVDPGIAESFRRQGAVTIVTHTKDDSFIEQVIGKVNNDMGSNNTCHVVAGPLGVSMAEQVSGVIGQEFNAYTSGRTRSASASFTLGHERNSATFGSDSNRSESVESRAAVPTWELTGNEGIIMARDNNVTKLDANGQPLVYDPYLTKSQASAPEPPVYAKRAARMRRRIPTLEQMHNHRMRKIPFSYTTASFVETCITSWEAYCKMSLDNDTAPLMFEDWLSAAKQQGLVNPHLANYVVRKWRKRNGL